MIMNKLKLFIALAFFICLRQGLYAYSFTVDGFYYSIISMEDRTVSITNIDGSTPSYSGNIIIPSTVTYLDNTFTVSTIGYRAFYNCDNLYSVKISRSITTIGEGAFYGCSHLIELVIPSNVIEIGSDLIYKCYNLKKLIIEDSPETLNVGSYHSAFGESALEYVYLGRCLSYDLTTSTPLYPPFSGSTIQKIETGDYVYEIPQHCFIGCKYLREVILSNRTECIKKQAFYDCKSLERFVFPECLTSIESYAFSGTYFKECVFLSKTPPSGIENVNSELMMVPGDVISKYCSCYSYPSEIYPNVDLYFTGTITADVYNSIVSSIDKNNIRTIGFYKAELDPSLTVDVLKKDINPNCVFLVPKSSVRGKNIVEIFSSLSYKTKSVEIDGRKSFQCPVEIQSEEIKLSYYPTLYADGSNGWETISLPFDPSSIIASEKGSIVPITTGSSGNFWLRQYVGSSDDAVYFASTSDGVMKANTPYLIAFPGGKMGKGSLEGQTITFKAKNVTIPVTTIPSIQKNGYTFVGNYDTTADEGGGWTLNAEGNAFVWSETVGDKPFSAYFKSEAPAAGASALRMSFGQMDNATGLEQNMADLIDHADEAVYTLDGRKVNTKDLKPGLYIKNHKKMMVR